jgi:hypothetical protein
MSSVTPEVSLGSDQESPSTFRMTKYSADKCSAGLADTLALEVSLFSHSPELMPSHPCRPNFSFHIPFLGPGGGYAGGVEVDIRMYVQSQHTHIPPPRICPRRAEETLRVRSIDGREPRWVLTDLLLNRATGFVFV